MKLRNYTSEVSAFKSQGDIERMLVAFGAQKISKLYENSRTVGMLFEITSERGPQIVRIPARVKDCANVLLANDAKWKYKKEALEQQAERTAWKLMLEWVHIQLSMIQMGQAKPLEVFLPYIFDGKQTLFTALEANNFKALPAPKGEQK